MTDMSLAEQVPAGLVDAETQAQDALRRADSKATTLLQLVGLALAGVMALVSARPNGAAAVLLWLALAPILASVVLLLITILPRLGRPVPGTWLHAAQVEPSVLLDTYADTEAHTSAVAAHTRRVARLAARKYRLLQLAVWGLIAGLAPLVAALTLIA